MSQTFKIYTAAASDGLAYIDMPVSGRIVNVHWNIGLSGGAGGLGQLLPELSRSPVNQVTTNNPRGVISMATAYCQAASTGIFVNVSHCGMSEPVRQGERLYVNAGGAFANVTSCTIQCLITVA